MLRRLAAATTLGLMLAGGILPAAAPPPHPALARGLALMRDGDFEAAVLELDAAVRKIESEPAAGHHRAWGYVYLGVAYLELEQEAVARGKFREALARDPGLTLLPAEFSAQSIRVFEGVRAEAATALGAPPVRAPVAPRPSPGASATPSQEKKGSKGPLVAVLVGGAAAAGAAVALGGGGGGAPPTTPVGGGTSTVPSASPSPPEPTPIPTPTPPGPGPTPTPGPAPTPGPTPTPPPPTPPPACMYSMGGAVPPAFGISGGSGTCSVRPSRPDCSWTAVTNASWINLQNSSGTGDGTVTFNVEPNTTLMARSAQIRLLEGNQPSCTVSQSATPLTGSAFETAATWTSDLYVPGGRGQVVVDGTAATFQEYGSSQGWIEPDRKVHRIEGTLVTADGRPGTWRFRLSGPLAPGSLRVIAGEVAAITPDTVAFRLAGKPGERLVFTFAHR